MSCPKQAYLVFYTPDRAEWLSIKGKCTSYLDDGRHLSGMPNANRVWMLYGFEIFRAIKTLGLTVIETYPQAIVRQLLGDDCPSKLTEAGFAMQRRAVANATGWEPELLEDSLAGACTGQRHDRLDAFAAAWVAALGPDERMAYGNQVTDDGAIWVPALRGKDHLWRRRGV